MTDPGIVPVDYQALLGAQRRTGSEFGGVDGVPPLDPTPSDRLAAIYATDPTDPLAEVDTDEAVPAFRRKES